MAGVVPYADYGFASAYFEGDAAVLSSPGRTVTVVQPSRLASVAPDPVKVAFGHALPLSPPCCLSSAPALGPELALVVYAGPASGAEDLGFWAVSRPEVATSVVLVLAEHACPWTGGIAGLPLAELPP